MSNCRTDGGNFQSRKQAMIVVDSVFLAIFVVGFLLLLKLGFFHIYLCKNGLTTYELVLRQRNKNKVIPKGVEGAQKDNTMLKNMKRIQDLESYGKDDSRDEMNLSIEKSCGSHRAHEEEEVPEIALFGKNSKLLNKTKSPTENPATNVHSNKKIVDELPTTVKNKGIFETRDQMPSNKEDETKESSHLSMLSQKAPFSKSPKHSLDPMKDDSGSFALSKPLKNDEKSDLATRLDKPFPKLLPPVQTTNPKSIEKNKPLVDSLMKHRPE